MKRILIGALLTVATSLTWSQTLINQGTYDSKSLVDTNSTSSSTSTINTNTSTTLTYGGVIAGGGNLTKDGVGILLLSGNSSYTGSTTISSGTLQLGDGTSATGSLSTSSVTNNAALKYDSSADQTISYVISGSGTVEVVGRSRTLNFAANAYLTTTAQTL